MIRGKKPEPSWMKKSKLPSDVLWHALRYHPVSVFEGKLLLQEALNLYRVFHFKYEPGQKIPPYCEERMAGFLISSFGLKNNFSAQDIRALQKVFLVSWRENNFGLSRAFQRKVTKMPDLLRHSRKVVAVFDSIGVEHLRQLSGRLPVLEQAIDSSLPANRAFVEQDHPVVGKSLGHIVARGSRRAIFQLADAQQFITVFLSWHDAGRKKPIFLL